MVRIHFIWILVTWLGYAPAMAQSAPKSRTVRPAVKKRAITEAEAKQLHEAQLAAEGKTGVRRAYKRNQFDTHQPMPTVATAQPAPQPASRTKTMQPVVVQPAAAAPPRPRFIEHLVLERTAG
jgi:hypothetical protein